MIELVYSQQSTGFDKSLAYSNPRFFTTPRSDVSKVYVVGDWPKVVAAYEALGIPVERLDAAPVVEPPPTVQCPPELASMIRHAFPPFPAKMVLEAQGGAIPSRKTRRKKG
jgi:hypothetical protein